MQQQGKPLPREKVACFPAERRNDAEYYFSASGSCLIPYFDMLTSCHDGSATLADDDDDNV